MMESCFLPPMKAAEQTKNLRVRNRGYLPLAFLQSGKQYCWNYHIINDFLKLILLEDRLIFFSYQRSKGRQSRMLWEFSFMISSGTQALSSHRSPTLGYDTVHKVQDTSIWIPESKREEKQYISCFLRKVPQSCHRIVAYIRLGKTYSHDILLQGSLGYVVSILSGHKLS